MTPTNMKYLKCFEAYTDEFLANAPSESTIRDWFTYEFEDNEDFDLEDIIVSKIDRKAKGDPGILYYEYKVTIEQDFHKKLEPIYLASTENDDYSYDIKKEVAETNDKIFNKFVKKYNIHIEHSDTWFQNDFDVMTVFNFYFLDKKTYENTNYKSTSWSDTIDGKEVTITIDQVQDFLKDVAEIKIPVNEIKDKSIHKSKNDEATLDRVLASDLSFPIIITKDMNGKYGMILDGHHRLQKAINTNQKFIKAKVLDLKTAPKEWRIMFN